MNFEQMQESDKTIIKIIIDEKTSLDEFNILKSISERANKEMCDYKQKVLEVLQDRMKRRMIRNGYLESMNNSEAANRMLEIESRENAEYEMQELNL